MVSGTVMKSILYENSEVMYTFMIKILSMREERLSTVW